MRTSSKEHLEPRWVFAAQVLTLGLLFGTLLFVILEEDPALMPVTEASPVSEELDLLRVIPRDEFVFVSAESPQRWVLGPGFSIPEADGAWVSAREAKLRFSIERHTEEMFLEISMSPLLVGLAEFRSVVIDSGAEAKSFMIGSDTPRPIVALPNQKRQEVIIQCESLDSPTADQDDLRRLCVKLYGFAVRDGDLWGSSE